MLTNSKPIILIPTTNKDQAKEFYQNVLGLSFESDDGFALVFDSGGIMLRISSVRELTPHEFAVLGWEVPDIAAAIRGLVEKGVEFERYDFPWMTQDEDGAWTAPDGTKVAWFKDPDGNLLSVTQHAV
jgi:catechol 2,3-dioxygenase-like lactoylglutathione lyase family enzyme